MVWSGWDCWGMVVCLFRECYGRDLPAYDGAWWEDDGAQDKMDDVAASCREVPLSEAGPGDIVVFRPLHAGVVIGRGRFVHAALGRGTAVERLSAPVWRDRILSVHRHEALDA